MFFFVDDEVYMPNTSDLEEYVLNDQGVLFLGTSSQITPFRWYFGQVNELDYQLRFKNI